MVNYVGMVFMDSFFRQVSFISEIFYLDLDMLVVFSAEVEFLS